jgi:hypothetical protein
MGSHNERPAAAPAAGPRYLAEEQEAAIGGLVGMTLAQLGLGTSGRALVTVDPNMPTLLAFELMLQEGVSGAAVVSRGGELIANLSTSDLRWAAAGAAAGAAGSDCGPGAAQGREERAAPCLHSPSLPPASQPASPTSCAAAPQGPAGGPPERAGAAGRRVPGAAARDVLLWLQRQGLQGEAWSRRRVLRAAPAAPCPHPPPSHQLTAVPPPHTYPPTPAAPHPPLPCLHPAAGGAPVLPAPGLLSRRLRARQPQERRRPGRPSRQPPAAAAFAQPAAAGARRPGAGRGAAQRLGVPGPAHLAGLEPGGGEGSGGAAAAAARGPALSLQLGLPTCWQP